MQAKTIMAVISLVTMVGAAYAAGTSVAENLLREQNRDTGAVLEQAQRDWALSTETQDSVISFAPEVQATAEKPVDPAVESESRIPAAESPELRSLMSGGSMEEGYFFRSRGEDHGYYGYGEGHEDEDHEKHEKKEREKFGLFEGAGAFEEDD